MYKHHLYLFIYLLLVAVPLNTIHSLIRIGDDVETRFSVCVGEIGFSPQFSFIFVTLT